MIPLALEERVREMPAPKHIYMHKNVRGRSSRFPIWNKESQRFGEENAEEEHTVNKYEREEREENSLRNCIIPEAADCISPGRRERAERP